MTFSSFLCIEQIGVSYLLQNIRDRKKVNTVQHRLTRNTLYIRTMKCIIPAVSVSPTYHNTAIAATNDVMAAVRNRNKFLFLH